MKKTRVIGIIPARLGSTRFPGKLLADLNGKPVIQHVYEQAKKATMLDYVMVATDSDEIAGVVMGFGGNVCLCKNPKFDYPSYKKDSPICMKCFEGMKGIRNDGEMIALMHSELSEALEDLRQGNDKHVGSELADCVIRIMDYSEARDIDLGKEILKKCKKNKKRKYKHGKRF